MTPELENWLKRRLGQRPLQIAWNGTLWCFSWIVKPPYERTGPVNKWSLTRYERTLELAFRKILEIEDERDKL